MTTEADVRQAIVQATTLSCLLTIDYVNGAKHPPIKEMVCNELPNVLRSITRVERLGLELEHELMMPFCKDPKALVSRVVERITRHRDVVEALSEGGHCDMVYGAMKYLRKPPQSDEEDIDDMTEEVAAILGCDCDPDRVIDAYTQIHTSLIRI